jgi:hypothetical protein
MMPVRVEIYTADGIATGQLARAGRLRDVLESDPELLLERATWHPLDGTAAGPAGELRITTDDIHVVVGDLSEDGPVHAQWHALSLDVGPYRLSGEMPTLPGFDPGRALARPTGEFVLLRDIQLGLMERPDGGSVEMAQGLVNRYVVDRVEADLMLGFFFPGAAMVVTSGAETTEAGSDATASSTPPTAPPAATTPA